MIKRSQLRRSFSSPAKQDTSMMDTRDCACGQTTVRDDAARWFVRLQEPAVRCRRAAVRFEAWLDEHPQHRERIQLLQGLVESR
jgi:transmembrane sensor